MKKFILSVSMVVAILLFCTAGARSEIDVNLRGQVSSLFILRDTNGFQHGFMDNLYGTQWRNELKFDLTIRPVYKGVPAYRLEKVFLSYRGAYDAIFDCRPHAFENIQKHTSDDFELGQRDLETENDLREAFVDFVGAEGMQKVNLRLGRQIVRWGETDTFNVINVVNPSDYSYQMNFANPDDLAMPLWMGRLDYSVMGLGIFDTFGLQILVIPDIKPSITAPLNGKNNTVNFDAPYAYLYKGFDGLGITHINEDIDGSGFNNMEYGLSTTFGISGLELALYYFTGYQNGGAADWSDYLTFYGSGGLLGKPELTFRHPRQRVYGYSFNYYIAPLNGVLRGEGAYTNRMALTETDFGPGDLTGIAMKKVIHNLIGFDKDLHPRWIGTDSALTVNLDAHWKHIKDWEDNRSIHPANLTDSFLYCMMMMTDYYHGQIKPTVVAWYDPEGNWMSRINLKWDPDGKWLYEITEMSYWGNTNGISDLCVNGAQINTSELSFKVTYRF